MTIAEVITVVKDLGIPAAILGWLAYYVIPRLDEIKKAFQDNTTATALQTENVRQFKDELRQFRHLLESMEDEVSGVRRVRNTGANPARDPAGSGG